MKVTKVQQFLQTVDNVRGTTNYMKCTIGDSTENNRTITVSQFVAWLSALSYEGLRRKVINVYNLLLDKGTLQKVRIRNNRTDAYDLNEFTKAVARHARTEKGNDQIRRILAR